MDATQDVNKTDPTFQGLPQELQDMIYQHVGLGKCKIILISLNPGKISKNKFKPAIISTKYSLAFNNSRLRPGYNTYIYSQIRDRRSVVHVNIEDGNTANFQAFLQQAAAPTLARFKIAAGVDITSDEALTGPYIATRLNYTSAFSYDVSNDAFVKLLKCIKKLVGHDHLRVFYRVKDDFESSPGPWAMLEDLYRDRDTEDVGQAKFMNEAIRHRFSDEKRTVGQLNDLLEILGKRNINEPKIRDDEEEEDAPLPGVALAVEQQAIGGADEDTEDDNYTHQAITDADEDTEDGNYDNQAIAQYDYVAQPVQYGLVPVVPQIMPGQPDAYARPAMGYYQASLPIAMPNSLPSMDAIRAAQNVIGLPAYLHDDMVVNEQDSRTSDGNGYLDNAQYFNQQGQFELRPPAHMVAGGTGLLEPVANEDQEEADDYYMEDYEVEGGGLEDQEMDDGGMMVDGGNEGYKAF